MPSMTEIYEKHSIEYDELVKFEDYENNLKTTLHRLNTFTNQVVAEFGTGTGRLTKTFIKDVNRAFCFDRSKHMLDKARINLEKYNEKIIFENLDHSAVIEKQLKADIAIEGWAFGHTLFNNTNEFSDIVKTLITNCEKITKPSGKIIIIETLGTNVDEPNPPGDLLRKFYNTLEEEYGFSKTIVRTDYKFPSQEDAERIMGFFFGEWIIDEIQKRNSSTIPEYTGIWVKTKIEK